jgi:hypothetical protein
MRPHRKDPIEALIDEKRAQINAAVKTLEDADQLIERLKIEIEALCQARGAINRAKQKPPRPQAGAFTTGNGQDDVPEVKRGRSLSESWKKVLARIGAKGAFGASIDDIAAYCLAEDIKLKRPTLRAQMSNYVAKHGYLARPAEGVFTLTPEGAKIAGVKIGTDGRQKEAGNPALTGFPEWK